MGVSEKRNTIPNREATIHIYIITGASRGIGLALAKKLLAADNALYCVSRKTNEALVSEAASKEAVLRYYEFDLSATDQIAALMDKIFSEIDMSKADSITLVNNAGILEPVHPLDDCAPSEIEANLRINLLAPMALSSIFIQRTNGLAIPKNILYLTSGAGRNPYYGWSAYCVSKAGINMLTQCAALEQSGAGRPVRVIAFSPGPVDTDMQAVIRDADPADFPDRQRFIDYQKSGGLLPVERAADAIIEILHNEKIQSGSIVSIRDLEAR